MKYVTLFKLTAKGREELPRSAQHFEEITQAVKVGGGTIDAVYVTSGRYDYVGIVEYPTPEAAFKAHVKIAEMGLLETETLEAFDMNLLLTSV
jgi:uncharacterized protein with GYD domain